MKKRRVFPRYISYLLLAVMALFFGLIAIFGDRGLVELYRVRRETLLVQQEIETLRQKNQQLLQEIHGLRDDPYYIEKIAREELGMARPGETIILLPREEDASSISRDRGLGNRD